MIFIPDMTFDVSFGIAVTDRMTVDSVLSSESEAPLQNKVIYAELEKKQDTGDYALKEDVEAVTEELKNAKEEQNGKNSVTDKRLTNLEKGLPSDRFLTDSESAYIKNVPPLALPYAEVSLIGGATKKSRNILSPSLITSIPAINASLNADGSVTVKNTNNYTLNYEFYLTGKLPAGEYTLSNFSGLPIRIDIVNTTAPILVAVGDSASFEYDGKKYLRIFFSGQGAGEEHVIKVMLSHGSEAYPYEPYFAGLRSAKVTEIESMGVNLFDESQITHATNSAGMASEAYGVVQDGVLIAKIGLYSYGITWKPFAMSLGAGTYTVSADCYIPTGGAPNPNLSVRLFNTKTQTSISASGVSLSSFDKWERISAQITVTEPSEYMLSVQGAGNAEMHSDMDVRFKNICVAKGNIAEYSPYKKKVFQIPEAVQTLDGYGEGLDSNSFNSVEWSEDGKRVFNRRVKTIALDESEEWYIAGNTFWTHINDSKKSQGAVLSNRYTCTIIDVLYVSVASTGVSTVDEFKAALTADPLYVTYIIDTPETVDMSELLTEDSFIEVEGNGTLTFKNEYGYAVPSEMTYMLKEI